MKYKSKIRPVITYACETWVVTQKDKQYLKNVDETAEKIFLTNAKTKRWLVEYKGK